MVEDGGTNELPPALPLYVGSTPGELQIMTVLYWAPGKGSAPVISDTSLVLAVLGPQSKRQRRWRATCTNRSSRLSR